MSSWDVLKGLNHLQNFKDVYYGDAEEDLEDGSDDIVEFVACGKQEVLDADMNYSLEQDTFAKPIDGSECAKYEEEKQPDDALSPENGD